MRPLFLAPIFLLILSATAVAQDKATINVTGTGSVSVAPDQAVVGLGVQTQARTAREALAKNSTIMSAVIEATSAQGIAAEDVQTTQVSLQPQWQHQNNAQPVIIGFLATNSLQIIVRDLGALGQTLDGLNAAGANNIQSIQFGIDDPQEATNEARKAGRG